MVEGNITTHSPTGKIRGGNMMIGSRIIMISRERVVSRRIVT